MKMLWANSWVHRSEVRKSDCCNIGAGSIAPCLLILICSCSVFECVDARASVLRPAGGRIGSLGLAQQKASTQARRFPVTTTFTFQSPPVLGEQLLDGSPSATARPFSLDSTRRRSWTNSFLPSCSSTFPTPTSPLSCKSTRSYLQVEEDAGVGQVDYVEDHSCTAEDSCLREDDVNREGRDARGGVSIKTKKTSFQSSTTRRLERAATLASVLHLLLRKRRGSIVLPLPSSTSGNNLKKKMMSSISLPIAQRGLGTMLGKSSYHSSCRDTDAPSASASPGTPGDSGSCTSTAKPSTSRRGSSSCFSDFSSPTATLGEEEDDGKWASEWMDDQMRRDFSGMASENTADSRTLAARFFGKDRPRNKNGCEDSRDPGYAKGREALLEAAEPLPLSSDDVEMDDHEDDSEKNDHGGESSSKTNEKAHSYSACLSPKPPVLPLLALGAAAAGAALHQDSCSGPIMPTECATTSSSSSSGKCTGGGGSSPSRRGGGEYKTPSAFVIGIVDAFNANRRRQNQQANPGDYELVSAIVHHEQRRLVNLFAVASPACACMQQDLSSEWADYEAEAGDDHDVTHGTRISAPDRVASDVAMAEDSDEEVINEKENNRLESAAAPSPPFSTTTTTSSSTSCSGFVKQEPLHHSPPSSRLYPLRGSFRSARTYAAVRSFEADAEKLQCVVGRFVLNREGLGKTGGIFSAKLLTKGADVEDFRSRSVRDKDGALARPSLSDFIWEPSMGPAPLLISQSNVIPGPRIVSAGEFMARFEVAPRRSESDDAAGTASGEGKEGHLQQFLPRRRIYAIRVTCDTVRHLYALKMPSASSQRPRLSNARAPSASSSSPSSTSRTARTRNTSTSSDHDEPDSDDEDEDENGRLLLGNSYLISSWGSMQLLEDGDYVVWAPPPSHNVDAANGANTPGNSDRRGMQSGTEQGDVFVVKGAEFVTSYSRIKN